MIVNQSSSQFDTGGSSHHFRPRVRGPIIGISPLAARHSHG
jgi:hypothetical protein